MSFSRKNFRLRSFRFNFLSLNPCEQTKTSKSFFFFLSFLSLFFSSATPFLLFFLSLPFPPQKNFFCYVGSFLFIFFIFFYITSFKLFSIIFISIKKKKIKFCSDLFRFPHLFLFFLQNSRNLFF